METIAFKMKLLPGNTVEYRKRHDQIWPELVDALKDAGIKNYRIFLDTDSNTLFAVLDHEGEQRLQALKQLPIMRKWWDAMAPLMQTAPDNEPITTPLACVFHLP